jgi:hypothetical protein
VESVRGDYLRFLSEFGIEPRKPPANAAQLRIEMLLRMVEADRLSGDDVRAARLEDALARERSGAPGDQRHPVEILLDRSQQRVVRAIRSSAYAEAYRHEVFVGDFPTGSLNAEARRTKHGYLILVNSGLSYFFRQIMVALCMRDPPGSEELDIISQAIAAYVRHRDPAAGPQPFAGGSAAMLSYALQRACDDFVVAHEFGHLLAGHLDVHGAQNRMLPMHGGEAVGVIDKSWQQEFEADAIGFSLLLGGRSLDDVKKIIDAGERSSEVAARGIEMLAALAAPMIFFVVESLVSHCIHAAQGIQLEGAVASTHPPSRQRLVALYEDSIESMGMYLRYANLAHPLVSEKKAIAERVHSLLREGL